MAANAKTSWGPWAAMNPMGTLGDATALWTGAGRGPGAAGAVWPVDPFELATTGLETWRWLVNTQIDFAVASLSALRR